MLIKTRFYDWDAEFAFAPPLRDIVLNTDHLVSIEDVPFPRSGSRVGPHVVVTKVDGKRLQCEGPISRYTPAEDSTCKK